ncbi:MAG TPA: GNAT family N-acetyltransferase [Gaiellales bacterium]|nr:GNAT family N-acetyltransferase [Gaiellales bacterium]
MVIRPAHPDEGERLREITAAAKGFWGYDRERVRAWAAALDLSPERLVGARAFVAEVDGVAVGWAEVLPPDEAVCVLEHLWVEPAWMRRGAGSQLFRHAAERAAGLGATALEWEAEPNALGFYARMGGRRVRTTTSEWGRELAVMAVPLPQ